ncbi:hypothetical protein, unlikely [Trypanosoma congolense IL3000]|uniref:Uncharacterized protein n=1 Tax=Trypanosoma congolense (strain IL3000) TaxID=1068625 RepID=F9WJJ5_TRYCI|nr:hypothetical protein, unlikely [Trypanosoma congolense IL3000]
MRMNVVAQLQRSLACLCLRRLASSFCIGFFCSLFRIMFAIWTMIRQCIFVAVVMAPLIGTDMHDRTRRLIIYERHVQAVEVMGTRSSMVESLPDGRWQRYMQYNLCAARFDGICGPLMGIHKFLFRKRETCAGINA